MPTNVVRLFHAVQDWQRHKVKQLKYYHPGVGTEGGKLQKMLGGGLGLGLNQNIQSAYYWLARNSKPGDQIYLFGFSRGAYTVRSLGGDESDGCNGVGIHFVGVWDTVGAVGIPDDAALLNLLDDEAGGFHDTRLSDSVAHARHALALDEYRASFSPTLWTDVDQRESVKQAWFPGAHSDVGGGYVQKGLSDSALKWMMDEAATQGLKLDPQMVAQVAPDFHDVVHDSATGLFAKLPTQPRNIPNFPAPKDNADPAAGNDDPSELLHDSAVQRHQNPPIAQAIYHPTIRLKVGEKTKVDVYAIEPWNRTGIYLEQGARYKFSARGQWMDKSIRSDADGKTEEGMHIGEMVRSIGTAMGMMETLFKKATGNDDADFILSRREEGMPWFSLVGAVANAGNPEEDGTPGRHQVFEIGTDRGSVRLTVERIP